MKRSTVLVLTFVIVMGGTMVLMQRLSGQEGPDTRPLPETKGPLGKGDYLIQIDDKAPQQEYDLNQKVMDILTKYQGAENSQQREQLRGDLQKLVGEQFDLRQQVRQKELEQLEAQVRRLRTIHTRRQDEKESIVKDRVQQLLRDAEGLGWGTDSATQYDMLQRWPRVNYPQTTP